MHTVNVTVYLSCQPCMVGIYPPFIDREMGCEWLKITHDFFILVFFFIYKKGFVLYVIFWNFSLILLMLLCVAENYLF